MGIKRRRSSIALGSALVLTILAVAAVPAAAQTGRCYKAELPAPTVFPDGSVHDAGLFKICLERRHSPVADLHRLHVGGFPTGFLASRRVTAEDARRSGPAHFVFERVDPDGSLRLLALVAPDGHKMVSHVFAEPKVRTEWAPGTLTRSRGKDNDELPYLGLHEPGEETGPFVIAMAN
jgi:hypothetical protein